MHLYLTTKNVFYYAFLQTTFYLSNFKYSLNVTIIIIRNIDSSLINQSLYVEEIVFITLIIILHMLHQNTVTKSNYVYYKGT